MKRVLSALPLPVCGRMLGLAALGNLLQAAFTNLLNATAAGNALRMLCGVLAALTALVIVLKVIFVQEVCAGQCRTLW